MIRPNALGKFEDLLVATAKSPAMLMYLDNWQSIGPDSMAAKNGGRFAQYAQNPQVKQALKDRGLNENYARELMELHTLGVQCEVSADRPVSMLDKACGQGYTQQDVTQVAKVLTGWTIDRPYRSGGFQFEERRHEPGSKTVMGKTIGESGENEGLAGAAHAGDESGDGEVYFDQAGGAVCERYASAGAGGPDGEGVCGERWRHQDGAADDVRFAGVLVAGGVPGEGEDAGGVCGVGGAGERGGGEECASAGAVAGEAGDAAVWDADAEWI